MSQWKDLTQMKGKPHLALMFQSGPEAGRLIPLLDDGDIFIGRGSGANVVISDKKASRLHAKLSFEGDVRQIEDLSSSNGTKLNGSKVEKSVINKGDKIQIGDCIMHVELLDKISQQAWIWWSNRPHHHTINPEKVNDDATLTSLLQGDIGKPALLDLMLFLVRSEKTGVLNLTRGPQSGKIYFEKGHIYSALINADVHVSGEKNVFRLLRWEEGKYEFIQSSPIEIQSKIESPSTALIIEGGHHAEQFSHISHLLPGATQDLQINPKGNDTANLTAIHTEILEMLSNAPSLSELLDKYSGPDLFAEQALRQLIEMDIVLT